MVTSAHASTFEISVALGLGVGEWLAEGVEEVEDVLEDPQDPHELRPASATKATTVLVETVLIAANRIRAMIAITSGP
jgi:hypothetical protein